MGILQGTPQRTRRAAKRRVGVGLDAARFFALHVPGQDRVQATYHIDPRDDLSGDGTEEGGAEPGNESGGAGAELHGVKMAGGSRRGLWDELSGMEEG